MTPEERIRELARKSAIDAEAAKRMLAALRPASASAARWNPFERVQPVTSTLLGVLAMAGMVALSALHIRTPGLIDLRVTDGSVALTSALLDQLVAFPLPVLVMWGVARAFTRHVRLIDMSAAVGLARLAVTVLALPLALLGRLHTSYASRPLTVALALFALVVVTIQVTLLVLGFRSATALRGVRLTISVVVGIFTAELVAFAVRAVLPG